jgi:hypothetical protein
LLVLINTIIFDFMNPRVLIKKSPVYSACPSCRSFNTIRRSSSRNGWEHFVDHVTFYRMFRCKKCGWRGYMSTLTITSKSIKTVLLYLFLGLASAFVVREILKRFVSWKVFRLIESKLSIHYDLHHTQNCHTCSK